MLNAAALMPSLMALVRSGLRGEPLSESERAGLADVAWEDLRDLARAHDLLPLIDAGVTAARWTVPAEIAAELRKATRLAEMRSDRAWDQLGPVLRACAGVDIPVILLKGPLLASRFYRTPGLRPFGDLDLLVPEAHRDAMSDVLAGLGYRNTDDQCGEKNWSVENHYHWTFLRDGGFPIEMHWAITYAFSPVAFDMARLWERSQTVESPAGPCRVLSQEDELIFLAAHITRHCFRLPLRNHVDLAALLERCPDLSWEALWRQAGDCGASEDVAAVLATGSALGLLTLPASAQAQLAAVLPGSLDLPFLAQYAAECVFMDSMDRWLDVQNAPSLPVAMQRLRKAVFPNYAHLWTPDIERAAPNDPDAIYRAAWGRRFKRLLARCLHLSKLARDLRTTGRMHRMFGDRRRREEAH